MVQRGLIFNERTGKTIKIGAATYNRLVLEGYTPDRVRGVLTPPAGAKGTPKVAGRLPVPACNTHTLSNHVQCYLRAPIKCHWALAAANVGSPCKLNTVRGTLLFCAAVLPIE